MEILNFILVASIIISFAAYFYYKTKQFRTTLPIQKKWHKARAGAALGIFMICVGLNVPIIYATAMGFCVAGLFIMSGFTYTFTNLKRAKYEGQYVAEELALNQK